MALSVGELAGYVTLDDTKFEKGVEKTQSSFKRLGGWLKDNAGKIGAVTGATVGAAVALGVAKNLEMGAARAKLQGQLGLSGKDAERAGKVAGQLYADNMTDSIEGANDAIRSVVQNMNVSVKSIRLKDIATQALTVSQAMDEDLNRVTAAASTLMRTGLAKNAQQAFDIITRGNQAGLNSGEDLLDTFIEYPTTFRQLGISGKDSLNLMNQGLKAGARNSDQVADAIKEFSIRAIDGSKTTVQGFKLMGLNAKDMREQIAKGGPSARKAFGQVLDGLRDIKDPVKRQTAAVDLFGTKAEDMGKALGAMDLTHAKGQIEGVGGATKRATDAMGSSAQSKVEGMKHRFELWTASLVEVDGPLGDVAAGVMAFGGQAVSTAGSLGSLLLAMRIQKASAIGVAGATTAQTGAQRGLNAALRANPIGIVITVLAALAAGLIYAYKKSETFRNIVNGVFKAVGKAVEFMWDKVIKPAFKLWLNMWFTVVGAILNGAAKAFGWVPKLGPKLKGVAKDFKDFKNDVNRQLDGVKKKVTVDANTEPARRKIKSLTDYMNYALPLAGSFAVDTPSAGGRVAPGLFGGGRALGGAVAAGVSYAVGERGPEILTMGRSGGFVTSHNKARMLGIFDTGGLARGAGLMVKGPRPERVLSPRQTEAFERLVDALQREGSAGRLTVNVVDKNGFVLARMQGVARREARAANGAQRLAGRSR